MTNAVKKVKVDELSSYELSKEDIKVLIMKLPNLQELEIYGCLIPFCHLNDVELPTSLTFITVSQDALYFQHVPEYINVLIKLRNTIQKFNFAIYYGYHYDILNNWDIVAFFGSFPKLTELDVGNIVFIETLAECLPIIQAIPSLKSFRFNGFYRDVEIYDTIQLKQKLGTLEKLAFVASDFLLHTLSFIVRNFTGLKEIEAIFDKGVLNFRFSTEFLKFLDFIYSIDTHYIRFKTDHKFCQQFLSNTISNTFNQLSGNNKASDHLSIITHLERYPDNDLLHSFQLEAYRDYYNRLQRKFQWYLGYGETYIDVLYNCLVSLDKINVDIFTFNVFDTPFQSCYFDLFFKILPLLKEPQKVVLIVSNGSKMSEDNPSNQIKHITQLEIQIKGYKLGVGLNYDYIPFSLCVFPNLKVLRLSNWCGVFYPKDNVCSLELRLLNLESLHLDVTPLISVGLRLLAAVGFRLLDEELLRLDVTPLIAVEFFEEFLLVIETDTLCHSYKVSLKSLYTTKISQADSEEARNNNCVQLYIYIKNVQHLYLHTSANVPNPNQRYNSPEDR